MKVTFSEYKGWIEKYINNNDTREINFQNDVVKRLLEKMFEDYDIVCVDTKCNDSKNHDYNEYSGMYEDSNGKHKPTTPDLLICKNWNWYNKDTIYGEKISYIATVEVKSPYGSEAIYKKDQNEYPNSWEVKIKRHLDARRINKVIFTDTFKWEFYEDNYENFETICLVNKKKRGRGYSYEWKNEKNANDTFNDLLNKLNQFLKPNNL